MHDNLTIHRKKNLKYFTFPTFQLLIYFVVINSHKDLFRLEQPHDRSLQAGQRQMKPKMQRFIIFMRLFINGRVQTRLFPARYERSVALTSQRLRQSTSLQRCARCLQGKQKAQNFKIWVIYFMTCLSWA